tara:strand:- start:951 stop:1565 length:615 start_codon:yes stop_codon:yes gene_type:complete
MFQIYRDKVSAATMAQHEGKGEAAPADATQRPWRRRFQAALSESLDLYTEFFAQSPAPMIVEDWSEACALTQDLVDQVGADKVEDYVAAHPETAEEIWMAQEHIAANPAMLTINRMPEGEDYEDYIDVFEPSLAPSIAGVAGALARWRKTPTNLTGRKWRRPLAITRGSSSAAASSFHRRTATPGVSCFRPSRTSPPNASARRI